MKISKFVNNLNEKPFHTSGFAEAANGNSIGAVSPESFERRKRIDRNRGAVRKYRESHIGQPTFPIHSLGRDAVVNPLRKAGPRVPSRQQQAVQDSSIKLPVTQPVTPLNESRTSFSEPTKRRFDPFQ